MRSGDVVKHRLSGETWVLAYADGDEVSACGWPESWAKASDCDLVKAASDEEYKKMLHDWADRVRRRDNGDEDHRHTVCKRLLAEVSA